MQHSDCDHMGGESARLPGHTWAVVLAAGDGKRLAELTADPQGRHVPKQFCSVHGGPSLFGLALARARAIVPAERVCAVVARTHEQWWAKLQEIQPDKLIVQPQNRGTGNGVLLALAHILRRDPQARVIFLPADHHVLAEEKLIQSALSALAMMPPSSREIFLLGIEPDEADPELGYIVPQKTPGKSAQGVRQFVEKPPRAEAAKLVAEGGLWNSAIFAANGEHLLELFRARFPGNALGIKAALGRTAAPCEPSWALGYLYEQLPEVDFSRDILQCHAEALRVVTVPHCGWSDLGTPVRVSERVKQLFDTLPRPRGMPGEFAFPDLAQAVARAGNGGLARIGV